MRISKIKISGFKSFVDPTTLDLPTNLTGIVGPNGCGKSNIIDALLWVLGESSAKHLRGDSMTDVIFTGSNTRKPVGQASVEIIFDNSDGSIGGQYASYAELAIKRVITREGVSQYWLNGSRCRRRDVTNIFLGTGIGSRSYSVIEQGMISRVIEAKPVELRNFLEEAAGISKYKERRRETENRIRHTRENISRLDDIRDELEKQINRLNRQAKAAERYKVLKLEERKQQAEVHALNWKRLKKQGDGQDIDVQERLNEVENATAGLRETEAKIEQQREDQHSASDAFNQVQATFYKAGAEISRLEQSIKHLQDRRETVERDLRSSSSSLSEAETHLTSDQETARQLDQQEAELTPQAEILDARESEANESLQLCERKMQAWQQDWDQFSQQKADVSRNKHVLQSRVEHLDSSISSIAQRVSALREEQAKISADAPQNDIEEIQAKLEGQTERHQQLQEEYENNQLKIRELRESIHSESMGLDELRTRQQQQRGRLSSLEALQQSALGQQQGDMLDWLRSNGLENATRLAQQLTVGEGWEHAVEIVLDRRLEAVCVDSVDSLSDKISGLTDMYFCALDSSTHRDSELSGFPAETLASKVSSGHPVNSLLGGIFITETLEQALSLRGQLLAGQSIITRDGSWLGSNWLEVPGDQDGKAGVLSREKEIRQLVDETATLEQQIAELNQHIETKRQQIRTFDAQSDDLRKSISQVEEQRRQLSTQLASRKAHLEQITARGIKISEELSALEDKQSSEGMNRDAALEQMHLAEEQMQETEQMGLQMSDQRQELQSRLQAIRDEWRNTRDQRHQTTLQLETLRTRRTSLLQAMQRNQSLVEQLQQRSQQLQLDYSETEEPIEKLRQELQISLQQRVSVETNLAAARNHLQTVDNSLRELENQRHQSEELIQTYRDRLEQARMAARECQVRLQGIEEQVAGTQFSLEELLTQLSEEANIQEWTEELEKIGARIHRLGPINLAAIDEFARESERKDYLDKQHTDLTEALNTLETAINKIDRETRTRFQETFDKVNTGVQELFPILFGGGHAYLELTDTDLLETGVTVMARPPGKRNSSIHLLSGGEKALTAVAFIFSLFKLNPAPFCLLDEVDAPLDDANVVRLCDMVKHMSESIQFVFITHNKITMEISRQLIGVTMHEPGVSRLVSVDMDEAMEMVKSA